MFVRRPYIVERQKIQEMRTRENNALMNVLQ